MGASLLCVAHCMLTPLVISFSAILAHALPGEERTHRVLAIAVTLLGAMALARGFRVHRKTRILALMLDGLICIVGGAYFGDRLLSHTAEVAITFLGSTLMITAHRLNHTFCQRCQRCVPADGCE